MDVIRVFSLYTESKALPWIDAPGYDPAWIPSMRESLQKSLVAAHVAKPGYCGCFGGHELCRKPLGSGLFARAHDHAAAKSLPLDIRIKWDSMKAAKDDYVRRVVSVCPFCSRPSDRCGDKMATVSPGLRAKWDGSLDPWCLNLRHKYANGNVRESCVPCRAIV